MTRPAILTGLVLALLGMGLLFAGCNGSSGNAPRKKPRATTAGRAGGTIPAPRCEEFLGQAYDMLQPDRLGISAEREVAVGVLNQWLTGCEKPGTEPEGQAPANAELKESISPAAWSRMHESHFALRDAGHIRNALLFRTVNDFVLEGAESDLDRAVRLFDYVTRNVALEPAEQHLPLTPYEILVFGRGTAADRAWIFAELLRQLRIDAVILKPSDGESDDWLVGVPLNGQVYLFDPARGTPIPRPDGPGENALVTTPATLEEFAAGDEQGQAYRSPRVEVVGYSSYWADRMDRLQQHLAGERSVIVYDPLLAPEGRDGALARVAEAGDWQRSDVGVWTYPEEQWVAFEEMGPEETARLQNRWAPFSAPVPIAHLAEDGNVTPGPPQSEQLKARLRQLQGDFPTAIRKYLAIRMAEQRPPTVEDVYVPPEIQAQVNSRLPAHVQEIHRQAAEDALFWTGIAQLATGDDDSAMRTFRNYVGRHPQGQWVDHVRRLAAEIWARHGQLQNALRTVDRVEPSSPQAAELEFLQERLEAALNGAAAPETRDPAPRQ